MADLRLIRASDGTGSASMATVQATRSPLATTITVDTVNNLPTHFVASMGTPHTFTDPITSETITVISDATCVDFVGHLDSGNIEIDSIAPGYTDIGSAVGDVVVLRPTTLWSDNLADTMEVSHNDDGTLKDDSVGNSQIKDGAIDTRTLAQGAVTPDNLGLGPQSALVAANQTTTSSTFTDLATVGPTVTVTIGANGLALISLGGIVTNSSSQPANIGFAASGANTIAPSPDMVYRNSSNTSTSGTGTWLLTGLNPGATTFTAKYSVGGGTGTFIFRHIAVVPL